MTNKAVLYDTRGQVGILTLNRPDQRNAMSRALLEDFTEELASAVADEALRCLVVTGTGSCFSAGADLNEGLSAADRRSPHEAQYAMYEPFLGILDVDVPVVAALNGHAVGGGFGLALLCDLRVAHAKSKYGANFARLGLHSGLGISYLLPRLVGLPRAAELLFTGRLVLGDEAERIGLVNYAVEADAVLPRAMELASSIAAAAPLAVRSMKRSLRHHVGWDVRGAARQEAYAQAETLATADAREGISALLDKREPSFTGS